MWLGSGRPTPARRCTPGSRGDHLRRHQVGRESQVVGDGAEARFNDRRCWAVSELSVAGDVVVMRVAVQNEERIVITGMSRQPLRHQLVDHSAQLEELGGGGGTAVNQDRP
jgi:hypothetical protein